MIHFIVGKPGGGKTYYSVRQICHELMHGDRFIVTNVALNLEELAEFCHKECSEPVDISGRVRILNELESQQFWIYEGPGRECRGRHVVSEGNLRVDYPDFSTRTGKGVLYVIDEVHVHFGARQWQKTSSDCTHYQTQHRKLGDDVLLVTQHPEQVDKAFRRLAQDYTVIRYLANERILGFNVGRVFRRATYLDVKTKGDNQPAQETGYFRMEVGRYAKLYNTHAGVGIVGRTDIKERHGTGRPLWMLGLLILAVLAGIWFFPKAAVASVKWGISSILGGKKEIAATMMGTNVVSEIVETNNITVTNASEIAKELPQGNDTNGVVYVTGLIQWANQIKVSLSDGRVLDKEDVQYFDKKRVRSGGKVYEFKN
jgi:hypothetical protein